MVDPENEGAWSLIENMGDAAECVEEMLFIILMSMPSRQAEAILAKYWRPMKRGNLPARDAYNRVKEVMRR